jgi:hypothetical protein
LNHSSKVEAESMLSHCSVSETKGRICQGHCDFVKQQVSGNIVCPAILGFKFLYTIGIFWSCHEI